MGNILTLTRRLSMLSMLCLLLAGLASAEALQKLNYSLPRQPLVTALTQFAEQSALQILFRPAEIPEKLVGPIDGDFTPEALLGELLQHTHLTFRFGEGVVVIVLQQTHPPGHTIPPEIEDPGTTNSLEELHVIGIRGSIQRNLVQKQHADTQIDVLTAEDVNSFPDKNVADALQRIPGVSVDRIWGEGRDINIRGTDKDINRTLMNGQNVASAYWWANDNPSRGFNYTILASELIASLAVHKSPSADIDEGSIGGTVIIHTRKPFDMANNTLSLTLEEQYSELADETDPQISLLGSWKNNTQTLGLLASFNWQNRSMRRDGLEAFPDNSLYSIVDENGTTTDDVYVIWGGGSAIFREQRTRQTNNITLQWSPAPEWQAKFNYVASDMAMDNNNQNYLFMPGGFKLREAPPVSVTQPRFGNTGDGRQTLLGGEMGNPDSTGAALDAIFRQTYVRSAVYDVELDYHADHWKLHSQAGVTQAEGGSEHDQLYRFTGNTREMFSLSADSIEIYYPDLNPRDPNALPTFSSDSRDWIRNMQDEETYAQMDVKYEVSHDFIRAVKLGVKWRDHYIENSRDVGLINPGHPNWPMVSAFGLQTVSLGLTPRLHQQTATAGSLTRYAWVDKSLVREVIDPYLVPGLMNYSNDTEAFYRIHEAITAAYIKMQFKHNAWQGNLGLRAVTTKQTSSAYHEQSLQSYQSDYQDYLPSVNLVYELAPDILWRSSLARVMARPTFQNLSSNIVYDGTSGTASSGNPDLSPFRAKQLDTGLEWYFDEQSILSATYFFKDISTFIYTKTQQEMIEQQVTYVSRPYNAEGANISGVELQWQQTLGNGIGWLSNYTYTRARVPSPDKQQLLQLPGNSRDQINTSLYFENDNFSARLSYNYRSKSYGELISGTQDETKAYQQWDFSGSWTPRPGTTFFVEAINLSNEAIYYRTANNIPQGLYEIGRRFAVGVRLQF